MLKYPLILASGSPRRSELLSKLGLDFDVIKPDFDEKFNQELPALEVPLFLSQQKISQIPNKQNDTIYITSDTVVVLKDQIIGKPKDEAHAKTMLSALSDTHHTVVTGVSIFLNGKTTSFSAHTKVYFNKVSQSEIESYVNQFKPLDKAGSYGIQEWIGHAFIEKIEGNYDNVVGLPTSRVFSTLKALNLFQ